MKSAPKPTVKTIAAGEFKAKCLQLIDDVNEGNSVIVITKRGKALARLVAEKPEPQPFRSLFGRTPGVQILGDIISPLPAELTTPNRTEEL